MGFVTPVALAEPSDLAEWTEETAPGNATALLRSCTTLVLDATKAACYAIDETTGLATDAEILKAMQDATCIQAAAWIALGIDPSAGGVISAGVKTSKGIGTGRISYGDVDQAAAARAAAAVSLVPEAAMRLAQQNLVSRHPGSR